MEPIAKRVISATIPAALSLRSPSLVRRPSRQCLRLGRAHPGDEDQAINSRTQRRYHCLQSILNRPHTFSHAPENVERTRVHQEPDGRFTFPQLIRPQSHACRHPVTCFPILMEILVHPPHPPPAFHYREDENHCRRIPALDLRPLCRTQCRVCIWGPSDYLNAPRFSAGTGCVSR